MGVQGKSYSSFQVLGIVNDGAATGCLPHVHRQGLASFLTTPVDDCRSVHLYDMNLHLKGVSPTLPSMWLEGSSETRISQVVAYQELTFVALGRTVGVFHRLMAYAAWRVHDTPIAVLGLAGNVLVSVGVDRRLVAWLLPSSAKDTPRTEGEVVTDIFLPHEHEITCLTHPQSYKNKILLGTRAGKCILLNLKTGKLVHVFDGFGAPVRLLKPSPVLDVVAVGTEDGAVHLRNFRVDENIVTFVHGASVGEGEHVENTSAALRTVHAISFRSDGDESMITGDGAGNLFVWDLNEKALRCEVRHVHSTGAVFAEYLPGEPLLVTAGMTDNSVKVHIFDDVNGNPRVLRSREGHHLPPVTVRFCGHDGFSLVSAGMDRELRLVSAVNEARNRAFGQVSRDKSGAKPKKRRRVNANAEVGDRKRVEVEQRMPPIVAIASANLRERDADYANIVTVHEGMLEAHTWRLQFGVKHGHILKPPSHPGMLELASKRSAIDPSSTARKPRNVAPALSLSRATCTAVSPCGTYAIVGSEDGRIHCYNLQSGRHLGAYDWQTATTTDRDETHEKVSQTRQWGFAHLGSVLAVSVDACGDMFVSAGAEDRLLKFWNVQTREADPKCICMASNATHVQWCPVSDLVAVACDDFDIYVFDASTRKLARHFAGHLGPIVDACFDPSGRRLLSASADSTIRVWDLPSGCLADTVTCPDAPTSIAMAPNGDFIASTHVNNLGVKLWVDNTKVGSTFRSHACGGNMARATDSDASTADTVDTGMDESGQGQTVEKATSENERPSAQSGLSRGIVTLSTKPTTQWTVLSNLSTIQTRNKPVEAPKKSQSAPFFLPTVKGLKMTFDTSVAQKGKAERESGSHREGGKALETDETDAAEWGLSSFGRLVRDGEYEAAAQFLEGLDASGVDMEIRTLGGDRSRRGAAEYFRRQLETPCSYELSHAHLSVFLRAHGTALAQDPKGTEALMDLLQAQQVAWGRLRGSIDAVACLSGYFSGQV